MNGVCARVILSHLLPVFLDVQLQCMLVPVLELPDMFLCLNKSIIPHETSGSNLRSMVEG